MEYVGLTLAILWTLIRHSSSFVVPSAFRMTAFLPKNILPLPTTPSASYPLHSSPLPFPSNDIFIKPQLFFELVEIEGRVAVGKSGCTLILSRRF